MEDSDDSKSAGTHTGYIETAGGRRGGGCGGGEMRGREQVISFGVGAAS